MNNQRPNHQGQRRRGRNNQNRQGAQENWRNRPPNVQNEGNEPPHNIHERRQQPQPQAQQQQQRQQPGAQQQQQNQERRQPQNRERFPISLNKLKDLQRGLPNDLLMELEINPGWDCLLDEQKPRPIGENALILKVFEICLKSTQKNMLLQFLRKYYTKFVFLVISQFGPLLTAVDDKTALFAYNFLLVLREVCYMIPLLVSHHANTAIMILQYNADQLQAKLTDGEHNIHDLLKAVKEQTVTALDEIQKNKTEQHAKQRKIHGYDTSGAPPDDYKDISIYPTINDMQDTRPFVRINKIEGSYEDNREYIDTQFRLLREDFVRPLRTGVQNYLGLEPARRKTELKGNTVRYYFNVSCRGTVPALCDQGFIHTFQLAPRDYKTVDWERSKRFGNGTVIGLSCDNFQNIVFASVSNRNIALLKKGGLSVECCRAEDENYIEVGKVYNIIESTALFEAYRYNLKVLQDIDPEEMPMEKYIVKVDKNVGRPEYIQPDSKINLSPIMEDNRNTSTEVFNELNWPRIKSTKLDEAQYKAVQSAFFRNMCLIQGPPGTGKTYVGLLIVETMLLNSITSKPILVVCYTNHALDQFLEGILKFSTKIVRVGGMCKNEEIKQYSLAELRMQRKESVSFQGELTAKTARQYRYRLNQLRKQIDALQEKSNAAARKLIPDNALDSLTWGLLQNRHATLKFLQIELGTREYVRTEREENQRIKAAQSQERVEEIDPIRRMEEEIQSDDDDDFGDVDDNVDVEALTVVERLLALNETKKPPGQEAYIEYELTMNDRERLSEEAALILHKRLDERGELQLSMDQRWDLYRYWHGLYMKQLRSDAEEFREEYSVVFKSLKEVENETDLDILREAQIIGMTTTGAAKYKSLYERLGIEVVIVEEAAELLEAHVVTTISKSTKQLILIGDHQQLRPSTADYQMAKTFKLDVSLFERLISNDFPFVRLELQHRMRPVFTKLLVPHIYKSLESGPRVSEYENIEGMSHDLQLMDHKEFESHDSENRSKSNLFECGIIMGLVKYLILQEYKHEQITVLAMYSGQQFLMKQEMRKMNYAVRVTSVDNYQGEENDIVIISFVRSNEENTIGFLGTLNRLCVAFSRARMGLFCIGNFTMIANKMKQFNNMLESVSEHVTNHFRLRCKVHGRETRIYNKDDFKQVSEGGCSEPCGLRLMCGHSCPRQCHVYDLEHKTFKCPRPCTKTLECGHECRKTCSEKCGNCTTPVPKVIPKCGHSVMMLCSMSVEEFECTQKCKVVLPCGHPCPRPCGKVCVPKCLKEVTISALCGHRVKVKCHMKDDPFLAMSKCEEPCNQELQCEHICQGTCGDCNQGRLHTPCKNPCNKQLICGHTCKEPCSQECPPCKRKCENSCVHSKCDRICGAPCIPCAEPCARQCRHQKCERLCSQPCSTEPCKERCQKKLKCGHKCIGFCTDDCPNKCATCCKLNNEDVADLILGFEEDDSIYVMLDCRHIIESEGMQQWVATQIESNEISAGAIKCPCCNSIVKKCNRYIHYINEKRRLIERVKQQSFGLPEQNKNDFKQLLQEIYQLDITLNPQALHNQTKGVDLFTYEAVNELLKKLQNQMRGHKVPDKMVINQWRNLFKIIRELISLETGVQKLGKLNGLWTRIKIAASHGVTNRIGQQQFDDMVQELMRFEDAALLADELTIQPADYNLKKCLSIMTGLSRFNREKALQIKNILNDVRHKRSNGALLGISLEERIMIIKATNMRQGHWYTCPNGHVYCIENCGRAMQQSVCNVCKAPIGGGNHRLLASNRATNAMTSN